MRGRETASHISLERRRTSLTFTAKLTGHVNQQTIHVTGTGHVDPELGVTDGTYEFEVPKNLRISEFRNHI